METNERALLRSKEGEKSVSIDCLPIFLPLLQDESSKILPENRSSSNFSPHLETYVQFRPHDRKRLSSCLLVALVVIRYVSNGTHLLR